MGPLRLATKGAVNKHNCVYILLIWKALSPFCYMILSRFKLDSTKDAAQAEVDQ